MNFKGNLMIHKFDFIKERIECFCKLYFILNVRLYMKPEAILLVKELRYIKYSYGKLEQ